MNIRTYFSFYKNTMPENQQTPQTVDLSSVNSQPKKEGFFDRMLKSSASFIAKATGQPDPLSWAANTVSQQAPQAGQSALLQAKSEPGFFDKLVASTQGLLAKTQQITNSVVNTTQNISNTVVNTANSAAQMVASAPGNIANTVSNVAQQTAQTAQNLASQATQSVEATLQKTQQVWSQIVENSTQAISNIKDHATDFVENPVSAVQNTTQNVVNQAQNITAPVVNQVSETLNQSQENHSDQQGLVSQLHQGIGQVIQKTKEVGSEALANTKEFVQNPINKIDQIAGAWVPQAPVQTETENTTSLDKLEQTSENPSSDLTSGVQQ